MTWDIFEFSSETVARNSTKLDRKQDLNVLYQVYVFLTDQKKQDGHPSLWLAETFSTSPLKQLKGIKRNLIGSKTSTFSTKFVFFGPIRKKTRLPSWPLLGKTFPTSALKPLNGIQRNLTDGKYSTPSIKFVFFGPISKTRWPPPASDWLRHFRLFWNFWTEFNETWQESRSQRFLPILCFSGWSEKQDGRPGLWLAETFSTSETAEWILMNLDRKPELTFRYYM